MAGGYSVGEHTITVIAKANGYKDSNISNSVIYNVKLVPGLYETGSDYTVLLKSWNDLVGEGQITVADSSAAVALTEDGEEATTPETEIILSVTDATISTSGDLLVPAEITNIGDSAFKSEAKLTGVRFEEGSKLTSIGKYAFSSCTGLTSVGTVGSGASVEIPNGVTVLSESIFYGCSNLTSIEIPKNIKTIEKGAFYNCKLVNEIKFNATEMDDLASSNNVFFNVGKSNTGITVIIGKNVMKVPAYLFYPYSNMESYSPKIISVEWEEESECTSIGNNAFQYCIELTDITIPKNIKNIGNGAFLACKTLSKINFNATEMNDLSSDDKVFANVGNSVDGTTVIIGANVTKIPAYLFYSSSTNPHKITDIIWQEGSVCTNIGNSAFSSCTGITTVKMPNSINSIGTSVFSGCTGLTSVGGIGSGASVEIPNGVSILSESIFAGCSNLTTIEIPEYIKTIEKSAFLNCKLVNEIKFNATEMNDLASSNNVFYNVGKSNTGITVTIGKNVMKVPAYLFYPYSNMESYSPKIISVEWEEESECTSIGNNAFQYCIELTDITIPENIKTLGKGAFSLCKSLVKINFNATNMSDLAASNEVFRMAGQSGEGIAVTIGKNITKIPAYLFSPGLQSSYAPNITNVKWEDGSMCTSIGDRAFGYCSGLTSIGDFGSEAAVEIPDTVTSIGVETFYMCTGITDITIPENIKTLGKGAFSYCTSLTKINFDAIEMNDFSSSVNEASSNNVFKRAGQNGDGISVTIGANVTKLPQYLFKSSSVSSDYPKITHLFWEEGSVCTSINTGVFKDCIEITSVGEVGSGAAIEIPASITSIGAEAFYGCTGITDITISENIKTLGKGSFSLCKSLVKINFNATNMNDLAASNEVFRMAGQSGEGIAVTIGKNITKIPAYLFSPGLQSSYAPNINNVKWEDGSVCTSIGDRAFSYCSGLTSIGDFGSGAAVEIPDTVTSIGVETFYMCTGITDITIPENIKTLGKGAFSYCTGLTKINFDAIEMNDLSGSNEVFRRAGQSGDGITVTIGAKVTKIPAYLFSPSSSSSTSYDTKITNVIWEEGSVCTSIGAWAFYTCTSLTNISIPATITSLANGTFSTCIALESIVIPNTIKAIGQNGLYNCSSLTNITFLGTIAEWKSISFGTYWNVGTGEYIVTCTDGTIAKDGTVTSNT